MKNRWKLTPDQKDTVCIVAEFLVSLVLWWNIVREMILAMPI